MLAAEISASELPSLAPQSALARQVGLEHESKGVPTRDLDEAFVILRQRPAPLGVAHQGEGGEEGQLQPVVEDEASFYAAVGQEEGAILLRQPVAVSDDGLHQILSSSKPTQRALSAQK